ncbi:hypothetical protein DWQ65_06645 [Treponema phagedenis]|uniref:Uncharacterized protein n=1 Tax=Treponema phagedenis TaxID=162 RepID=A0A0B7GS54_TREPH|nr:hypothetical protein FUT79_09795 [Treponema phagedenis]QEK01318.1 hypothetical protein FUT84_09270 [Treponema phagedenis]QSH93471.1 hypothetical protein C5O78_00070 [Treponema phagedenis]QSH99744.1 hypothetical protein DWQ65_06645 [Treponema phagedenis]TYT79597.1 hypothetical protein FS559_11215 [Treponema phagedenis]
MLNRPPLLNSKRCFKASIQNCKIEALKLVGEPKVEVPRVRPCAVSSSFLSQEVFKLVSLVFDMDVKTQNGHGRPWFQTETMF